MLARHCNGGKVDIKLEVDGLCGVASLPYELAALDVDADDQPAKDSHERAVGSDNGSAVDRGLQFAS